MKKLALFLAIIFLFSGCTFYSSENKEKTLSYSFRENELFPFYTVSVEDELWLIKSSEAINTNFKVIYSLGSEEKSYINFIKEENLLIFATNISAKNGITLCDLYKISDFNKTELIKENVRFDSIEASSEGNLIFIDENSTLFCTRNGITTSVENNVSQCVFVSNDTFLYRLSSGKLENGEYLYPIYSANADFRNFLLDGVSIISADKENNKAYIIKNVKTVQKRSASVKIADCFVYADGEILFDISSVILSQFENQTKHVFLLSLNQSQQTVKYDIYRVDSSVPALKASNILFGKYISKDRTVFAYETLSENKIKTNLLFSDDEFLSFYLENNASVNNLFYSNNTLFVFIDNELYYLENSLNKIDLGVNNLFFIENQVFYTKGKAPSFSLYSYSSEKKQIIKKMTTESFEFDSGYFYYLSGESNDLSVLDKNNNETAYISNVDGKIGFIFNGNCVAAVKQDDKSLFLADRSGLVDTSLKIKQFIY
ncbi:MAG: hypothetical protein IKB86_08670 [Clostridia bacterium]|nr:hypothetical protein [Clostridia bacterium]